MQSLIIRLPNHLGDVCMTLPALDRLAARGVAIELVGRRWAAELFAAYPWPVVGLPEDRRGRISALRSLRPLTGKQDNAQRNALLFTNSFSSALEFWLAGLHPAGYARDGRSLLLRKAIAVPRAWSAQMHTVEYYFFLAQTLLNDFPAPVPDPHLRLTDAARERAREALARAGVGARYIALCPVAQGLHHGRNKCWSGFGRMGRALVADGYDVVVCPGPGERAAASAAVPQARMIESLDLGAFAALLSDSCLVIANDSGPGHLAAAVGARLVGVFGVTDPTKTRPRSPMARIVGSARGWPPYEEVAAVVAGALAAA